MQEEADKPSSVESACKWFMGIPSRVGKVTAIEAMGGTLDIVARFPDNKVKITNFSSIDENETAGCGVKTNEPHA